MTTIGQVRHRRRASSISCRPLASGSLRSSSIASIGRLASANARARLAAVPGLDHLVAGAGQDLGERPPEQGLVVDDQHAGRENFRRAQGKNLLVGGGVSATALDLAPQCGAKMGTSEHRRQHRQPCRLQAVQILRHMTHSAAPGPLTRRMAAPHLRRRERRVRDRLLRADRRVGLGALRARRCSEPRRPRSPRRRRRRVPVDGLRVDRRHPPPPALARSVLAREHLRRAGGHLGRHAHRPPLHGGRARDHASGRSRSSKT